MLSLAIANLFRQRLRTLVTAGGVALAVGMLYCLLNFQHGYQAGLNKELDRLGAHILVVPKGCPYDSASIALHGAAWPCYLKTEYLATVETTRGVAVAAPVLMHAVYDKDGAQSVYCGITEGMLRLKSGWHIQEGNWRERTGELLIGSEVARSRGWQVGQSVTLPGLKDGSGTVSGILAPTSGADDTFTFLSLTDAQRILHRPNELTHILVRLKDPEDLERVTGDLRGCDAGLEMTVVPLNHLFETIQGLVRSTRVLLLSIALVALLAAGAGVANTFLMAVSERTREIGVLRAMGASPGAVFGLIWLETLALCLVGGLVGIAATATGSSLVEAWLRARLPFAPTDTLLAPSLPLALLCLGVGLVLGTFAALLPATRAARLSPAVAIREGA